MKTVASMTEGISSRPKGALALTGVANGYHNGTLPGVARSWAVWPCRVGRVTLRMHGLPRVRASGRPIRRSWGTVYIERGYGPSTDYHGYAMITGLYDLPALVGLE